VVDDEMTGPLPFQNLTLLNSTHNEVHNFILQLLTSLISLRCH